MTSSLLTRLRSEKSEFSHLSESWTRETKYQHLDSYFRLLKTYFSITKNRLYSRLRKIYHIYLLTDRARRLFCFRIVGVLVKGMLGKEGKLFVGLIGCIWNGLGVEMGWCIRYRHECLTCLQDFLYSSRTLALATRGKFYRSCFHSNHIISSAPLVSKT